MTGASRGWQVSVALHLLLIGGLVLLETAYRPARQTLVIDLSFVAGSSVAPRSAPRAGPVPSRPLVARPVVPPRPTPPPPPQADAVPALTPPTMLPVPQVATAPTMQDADAASDPSPAGATDPAAQSAQGYRDAHLVGIRARIVQRLIYPQQARRMGWSGEVLISFVILESGAVTELQVVESSGRTLLDHSALEAVRRAAPFPRPGRPAEIVMPIAYRLE